MMRQQPEGHDTFASGDSCFCVAKVAPMSLSIVTVSVNWLSDKRYWCVRINYQMAIKSDRAKVVMTAGCISITLDIPNYIYNSRERDSSINQNLLHTIEVCSIMNIKKVLPIDG